MTKEGLALLMCDEFCKKPVDLWESAWVSYDEDSLDNVGLDGNFDILALAEKILEWTGAK